MTVSDKALFDLGPFPAGVNNVAPNTAPPVSEDGKITSLREAVNVDLDAAGRTRRRRGYNVEVAGAAHSLFANEEYLFAVHGGALKAYNDSGAAGALALAATIRAGIGDRYASFTTDDDDTYWSNGVLIGRINAALADLPVWIDTPNPPVVTATAAGGLASGTYEVALTATDAQGRESGASSAVVVTLSTGQGISVTLPALPATGLRWRVYVSPPDGEVLYLAADFAAGPASYAVGTHIPGKALETQWLFPLLPSTILRYGHGRLLGLSEGLLVWSEAGRIGLMHEHNHLGMLGGCLLEPVGEGGDGAGWWVADHKRTYFMSGADPRAWQQIVRRAHPAVPGTGLTAPGTVFGLETTAPVAFWLGADGVFCLGLPGGTVMPLRDGELGMLLDAERGTAAYFEHSGLRQIVTSTIGGSANPIAVGVGDAAEATVTRKHGV